jgi:muramidase (phage lysozyme)
MSATVIDSLCVELSLDPKAFSKGLRDSLADLAKARDQGKKHSREIEDETKRSLQGLQKVAKTAFGLFAAFTAGRGIKDFASAMTQINANLGRNARVLDTNVQELGRWRGAIRTIGGDADGFTNTVGNLVGQFQQFSITGESSMIPYLRALNVSISDAQGHMRPFSDILLQLADRFQTMDPARAAAFGRAIGLDPSTINLLLQGRASLTKMLEEQKKYAPTPGDVKAAQQLQMQLANLQIASERLGITLLTRFGPAIAALAKWLQSVGDWLQAHPDVLTAIAIGLGAIGTAITVGLSASAISIAVSGLGAIFKVLTLLSSSEILLGLATLTEVALPGMSAAFLTMGAAIEATPIGWLLTGVALIIATGWELVANWQKIKATWVQIWDTMAHPLSKEHVAASLQGALDIATLGWDRVYGINVGKMMGVSTPISNSIPAEGQNLLKAISGPESGGRYNALYGGGSFSDYSKFPQWSGKMGPAGISHAAGRYQFQPGTWAGAQKALGLKDFSPANQDQAAWWTAQRDYQKRTGRDLLSDLRSGDPKVMSGIGSALSGTWASLPGGLQATQTTRGFTGALGAPTAALAGSAMTDNRAFDMSRETHIGTINVDAGNASDSAGAWRSIGGAVENLDISTQANSGQM